MTFSIPMPLRAAAGLAATVIDEARRLPDRLVGLPVLAVSTALQVSLKAQQRYVELVARGDQLLEQLRGQQESAPAWARFDDEEAARPGSARRSAFDVAEAPPAEAGEAVAAAEGAMADPATDLVPDAQEDEDMAAVALAEAKAQYDRFGAGGTAPEVAAEEALEAETGRTAATPRTAGTAATAEPVGVGGTGGTAGSAAAAEPVGVGAVGGIAEAAEPAGTAGDGRRPGESRPEEEIDAVAADPAPYERYLDSPPPLPGYDQLSVAQLRGKLRTLSEAKLVELIAYERAAGQRPAYLSMLENRLATVRAR